MFYFVDELKKKDYRFYFVSPFLSEPFSIRD